MTTNHSHYSLSDVAYQPHIEYIPDTVGKRPHWMSKTPWQRLNVYLTTHKPTALGWQCLLNEARRNQGRVRLNANSNVQAPAGD